MDVIALLSNINKVSLLAFFVTTLVVAYQIYMLKKEKTNIKTPSIPDFKNKIKSNEALSYTQLPSHLVNKDKKTANYSKLIFLIISLLTIIVVFFVLFLIKRNSSTQKKASISPTIIVSSKPTSEPKTILSPSPIAILPLSPTVTLLPSPTVTPRPSSTVTLSPSPSYDEKELLSPTALPTEIILAQAPSLVPTINTADDQEIVDSKPEVLPETGNVGKVLLIVGVAVSTIIISFFF